MSYGLLNSVGFQNVPIRLHHAVGSETLWEEQPRGPPTATTTTAPNVQTCRPQAHIKIF